jgi:hypothetical protein
MGLAVELLGEPGAGTDECDDEKLLHAYRLGVRNTLLSVGLAFGLEPVGPVVQPRPGTSPGLSGLLWAEMPQDV